MNSISEVIEDIRAGKMVIILDDEDRENEGDLIMAASKVRPEDINFMAQYGRGLICLALTSERCQQLQLPLMVSKATEAFGTRFTVSIEASEGVTTGISAYDRAHTIRTAVKPDAKADDLVQPGHVFPLMARAGGVLTRAGHTETGVDLARLADLEPAAVLVEILNPDGSMARRPELEMFARQHGLKMATVADLIRYRSENETTIERVSVQQVNTAYGAFQMYRYQDAIEHGSHLAFVRGDIATHSPLVRVHVPDVVNDILQVSEQGAGLPLPIAMQSLAEQQSAILVLLDSQQNTSDSKKQNDPKPLVNELRTYGIGAQILVDLGVEKMNVLSAPKRFHGLAGYGLEIIDYIEPDIEVKKCK
ncbi:MAG: 3,4-dihydroxy-2-butanone-4-phosphate synthase [bacterium]